MFLGTFARNAWMPLAATVLFSVVCVIAVAGEVASSPRAAIPNWKDVLYSATILVEFILSDPVPSYCCLGVAAFALQRVGRNGDGSTGKGGQWPKKKGNDFATTAFAAQQDRAHVPNFGASLQQRCVDQKRPVNPAGRGAATAPRAVAKQSRGCFWCDMFEDWLVPATEVEALNSEAADGWLPGLDSTDDVALVEDLGGRLSDLLGPACTRSSGAAAAEAEDALATVARFGGESSCFHRFLHATRQRLADTEKKLRKTIAWRRQVGANSILESSDADRVWNLMKPHWPEKIVGWTPEGHPVSYFDLALAVRTCQMDIWTEDNVQTFYIAWMERSLKLQCEGRQRHGPCGKGNNMPPTVVVYNLKGLRLSHILKCVSGLRAFCKILGIIEEHYPENLHKAVIINVPCVFYKMLWPIVQKALDERTLSNIRLSDGEGRELLCEVLGTDAAEVERLLGDVLRDGANPPSHALGTDPLPSELLGRA